MMTLFSQKRLGFLTLPGMAVILPLVLAGCSAAGVLNGVTPSSTFDRDRNVAYGEAERQVLDVYRAEDPDAEAPVIVFVHGGGWTRGSKDMYKFVAEGFTKDGFDVVVPNYRLYPQATYPDMIADTGSAIRKATDLFPGRMLVLTGHSAGAYNILMAALAPDLSGLAVCDRVAGLVSLAAPTGAYPMTDAPYTSIFPERFTGRDAPLARVEDRVALPPVMLVNGRADETVGYRNAEALAAAIGAVGGSVTLSLYDGMNHIDPVRVLSRHFDDDSPLKRDMMRFIDGLGSDRGTCAP
ncbi:alpha/beta hydrolase [uncultured Algimonas sp.]|uniref:alpha/beta hydrolase n=1 Tax=uncultured Algimonas sp. TaxID=1547920 RepID=UPI0026160120|nr:alpha/beta hydrolase [uncultured Algimonas sp.]